MKGHFLITSVKDGKDTEGALAILVNWLYNGGYEEWLISPNIDSSDKGFVIAYDGHVGSGGGSVVSFPFSVRPTFYLTEDVTFVSGEGTSSEPLRVS